MTAQPLTGAIGAEIIDVDLRDVDDDLFAELHDAFLRYKVLVYRDQHITDDEHIAYGRRWGDLEIHPFIRNHPAHPETGTRAVYVNGYFTKSINGLEPAESGRLLTELVDLAKVPEYQCRVRWQPDTIVQWDNRCTQHYASPDYATRRLVQRVTVCGDRPF